MEQKLLDIISLIARRWEDYNYMLLLNIMSRNTALFCIAQNYKASTNENHAVIEASKIALLN